MAMAKKKKRSAETTEELSFEQSLADLGQVVEALEGGQQGLSQSLELYERGVALLKGCQQMLERVERRIEVLTGFDADGNPITQPFDDAGQGDSEGLEKKKASRAKRRGNPGRRAQSGSDPAGDVDSGGALF